MGPNHSKAGKSSSSKNRNLPLSSTAITQLQAVGLTTCKSRGEAAEAAFLAKVSSFGFGIAKPWGDSERYDFILDSGHRFWRVQVKSTARLTESRYRVKSGGSTRDYTLDQIDFLVAYIVPEDVWYVVPVADCVNHKSLRFYPHAGRKARLEKYREAWCQLACPREAPTPIDLPRRCQTAIPQTQPCPFRQ